MFESEIPPDCPFCAITSAFPTDADLVPASNESKVGDVTAFVVLSTPYLVAFLDHAPISPGHVLVVTRQHREKLSDVSIDEGAALGAWIGIISRAVMRALKVDDQDTDGGKDDVGDWNIVQNNGARAAQVVPHVHYHIIPRMEDMPKNKTSSWTIFGRGQREDLDEDDGEFLQSRIKAALRLELQRIEREQGADKIRLLATRSPDPNRLKL